MNVLVKEIALELEEGSLSIHMKEFGSLGTLPQAT